MKRGYLKPAMRVVKIQHRVSILNGSVRSVNTNLTGGDAVNYGGAGHGSARVKQGGDYNVWDDDWSQ